MSANGGADYHVVDNGIMEDCRSYKGIVLENYATLESLSKIPQMQVYPDDTFLISFPRTGQKYS